MFKPHRLNCICFAISVFHWTVSKLQRIRTSAYSHWGHQGKEDRKRICRQAQGMIFLQSSHFEEMTAVSVCHKWYSPVWISFKSQVGILETPKQSYFLSRLTSSEQSQSLGSWPSNQNGQIQRRGDSFVPRHAQSDFPQWAWPALGEQESEWHTMGFSALTVFTWRHSSRFEVVLLNSFCSPKAPWVGRPGDLDCEWLPESLGGGGRGCMSPRCFLVTWASGPCTVFTCFRRELGSV